MTYQKGKRLGDKYEIVELVGGGAQGSVYRAKELTVLQREVAIKVLGLSSASLELARARFQHEARSQASLNHPAILPVFEYGEEDGCSYFVSRYIQGGSLRQRLAGGTPTLEEALAILQPLAEALDYAHAHQVIHRDVKPANVLLGEGGRVYLADFGIAKLLDEEGLTEGNNTPGTADYISPEILMGESSSAKSDQYSLGVMAFEMLTGNRPFRGEVRSQVLAQHLHNKPRYDHAIFAELPGLPDAIGRALAKQPEFRFDNCSEFVEAMREAATHGAETDPDSLPPMLPSPQAAPLAAIATPPPLAPSPASAPAHGKSRGGRTLAIASAVAAVAVAAIIAAVAYDGTSGQIPAATVVIQPTGKSDGGQPPGGRPADQPEQPHPLPPPSGGLDLAKLLPRDSFTLALAPDASILDLRSPLVRETLEVELIQPLRKELGGEKLFRETTLSNQLAKGRLQDTRAPELLPSRIGADLVIALGYELLDHEVEPGKKYTGEEAATVKVRLEGRMIMPNGSAFTAWEDGVGKPAVDDQEALRSALKDAASPMLRELGRLAREWAKEQSESGVKSRLALVVEEGGDDQAAVLQAIFAKIPAYVQDSLKRESDAELLARKSGRLVLPDREQDPESASITIPLPHGMRASMWSFRVRCERSRVLAVLQQELGASYAQSHPGKAVGSFLHGDLMVVDIRRTKPGESSESLPTTVAQWQRAVPVLEPTYGSPAYHGSGFIAEIDGKWWLVTNRHVLSFAPGLKATFYDETMDQKEIVSLPEIPITRFLLHEHYEGQAQALDYFDLAIAELTTEERALLASKNIQAFQLHESAPAITSQVCVIGHPMDVKYRNSVTSGSVVQIRRSEKSGCMLVQVDVATYPGNSGGPVIDRISGKVVSVHALGLKDPAGMPVPSLRFGVSAIHLAEVARSGKRVPPRISESLKGEPWARWKTARDIEMDIDDEQYHNGFEPSLLKVERAGVPKGESRLQWSGPMSSLTTKEPMLVKFFPSRQTSFDVAGFSKDGKEMIWKTEAKQPMRHGDHLVLLVWGADEGISEEEFLAVTYQ